MILDFDLAMFADRETGATSNHRTGTAPFMARELLFAIARSVDFTHNITHDLESCFNLSVWYWSGYTPKDFPRSDPLRDWRKGHPGKMLDSKQAFFIDYLRANRILGRINDDAAREQTVLIRQAYRRKIRATEDKQELITNALDTRAREMTTIEFEAYLREHPNLNEFSQEAEIFRRRTYAKIKDSLRDEQIKESTDTRLLYLGISYKEIMSALGWRIQ